MTWIEVASDAVKIGLGAIIGGLLALISARQTHRHRVAEEYSRRRRDHLEKVMAEFDTISLSIMSHAVAIYKESKGDPKIDEALKKVQENRVTTGKSLEESQRELNPLEARVALMGFDQTAKSIEAFRVAACRIAPWDEKPLIVDEIRPRLISLEKQRYAVIESLATSYKNA